MEFQELRVFLAIIEAGGFKKASDRLRLTQSAVSQSIANLERKIGEKLVERTSPIRPTLVGYELLHHAQFILARESEFMGDLKRLRQGYLKKLTLAVDYLVNEYFCHPIIGDLAEALPEVNFKIKRLPAREMIKAVKNRHVELGFGPFQKNMDDLKKVKLFEESSFLVSSRSNKNLNLYNKNPMEFLEKNILLASYIDEPTHRPSKKKLRDYFKQTWEIDNLSQQIKLINLGLGISYLPATILRLDTIAKEFIVLDKIPFKKITKPYGIYYSNQEPLSEPASLFLGFAKEAWKNK